MIITGEKRLIKTVAALHRKGKTVVVKFGVFDLIHTNHVLTLEKLRKYGDIVLLIIWHDKDVAHLKAGRPVITQKDRARVLDAFKNTDIIFTAKNYFDGKINHFDRKFLPFLKKVNPDVVVIRKGSKHEEEYYGNQKWKYVGIKEFKKAKLNTTTDIIDAILKRYKRR